MSLEVQMAKSRNIIAIGGGGFGASPGQGIIEEYILKQTKKKMAIEKDQQMKQISETD